MPRINPASIEDAPEASRPVMEDIKKKFGKVPNIFATLAHSPAALKMLMSVFAALEEGDLSGKPHEAVALYVGEKNGCRYCTAAHTTKAKMAGATVEETIGFRKGQSDDAKIQAALSLAGAIVDKKFQVADEDVAAARAAGLTDAELLEIVGIAACNMYTNAINALVQTEVDFPAAPELT